MVFSKSSFIKTKFPFDRERLNEPTNIAPMYAREFFIDSLPWRATLNYCALGTGYVWINGKSVSDDLFPCPPSDYKSSLWYVSYDVTHLLREGKNKIVALCGNGFLNEDFFNTWSSHTLPEYRDNPKLILELDCDGEIALATDESWVYSDNSPYLLNRFRISTVYDARIPAPDSPRLDISKWDTVMLDDRAPTGVFRKVECEPIREHEILEPVCVTKTDDGKYLFDFGINSSGYVRIRTRQKSGDEILIRYSEELPFESDCFLNLSSVFYKGSDIFRDTLITSGEEIEWSTKLAYHGFRYAEISGIDMDSLISVSAVFVHQSVKRRSSFECSNKMLNRLFDMGIRATWSNMFYMPTDCPTREKYGWMNDAQSSSEQFLTNFHAESMLERWNIDIRDSFTDEYGFPPIVPTHGWGYTKGISRRLYNGPVSDGSAFEQVHRIYLHSGDKEPLIGNLPVFRKYFKFLSGKMNDEGFVNFGLHDWANPHGNQEVTPTSLVNGFLYIKFARIAALAARLAGEDPAEFEREEARTVNCLYNSYINPDGTCRVDGQTAVAMCIYFGVGNFEALKAQLMRLVEENNFHHDCGMVGLRYLYMALNKCSLEEYAYKIITAKGFPSYSDWIDIDATTLCEYWDNRGSKNHQMYSDFMSWLMKTVIGISPDENRPSFENIEVKPYFFEELDYAKGHYDAPFGRVSVEWHRVGEQVELKITAPEAQRVFYLGRPLPAGTTVLSV